VALHARGIRVPELAGEEVHHCLRHIRRVFGQKRPKEPHRAELNGNPKLQMLATAAVDQLAVPVGQDENRLSCRWVGSLV
jgi:hypothetical protein